MAKDVIPEIANRYQLPVPLVRSLYRQLADSGCRMVQFDSPELGGPGQWMPGMVMVSRWNDHQLKARVDGLCSELTAIICGSDTASPAAFRRPPGTPPAAAHVDLPAGESWWPAPFGQPAASGEQNGVRYAYFPNQNRLLVQQGARIDAFDTADVQLSGVSQQQGHTRSLLFQSDHGPVALEQLKCVPLA
ncbi:MAG TPA: hypothetical protein VH475_24760 [Tepidisphaeraceae bacterium]|jgi:hypothetical protein